MYFFGWYTINVHIGLIQKSVISDKQHMFRRYQRKHFAALTKVIQDSYTFMTNMLINHMQTIQTFHFICLSSVLRVEISSFTTLVASNMHLASTFIKKTHTNFTLS